MLLLQVTGSPQSTSLYWLTYPGTASCCNEAFKIATSSSAYLDNYFMYIGTDGVYSYTFKHEKREDCPVCGGKSMLFEVDKEWTVAALIDALAEKPGMYGFVSILSGQWRSWLLIEFSRQVKKPSLSATKKNGTTTSMYMQRPASLEEATRPNLEKKVSEFVDDGGAITVTATTLPLSLNLVVKFVWGRVVGYLSPERMYNALSKP